MITEAFRETMVDVEAGMATRVKGADEEGSQRHENRTTGNIVFAAFVHTVSRPIDGIPDPHCHIYGYVFNVTFDPVKERWKAGAVHEPQSRRSVFRGGVQCAAGR
jgi:TrwC relaxase